MAIQMHGASPRQFEVFNSLKAFRSLYFKDRKCFVVRIPAVFVNGYATNGFVSITPAVAEGKAYLILGLTDTPTGNFKGGIDA